MATFQQKLWPPNQTFSESYGRLLDFLKHCQHHRLLGNFNPELFTVYVVPLKDFSPAVIAPPSSTGITTYFHFRAQPDYILDLARAELARLLVAAVKTHFFVAENARVYREPVLFAVPDLSRPGESNYGLLYPFKLSSANSSSAPRSGPRSNSSYNSSAPPVFITPDQEYALIVADWDLALTSRQLPSSLVKLPVVLGKDSFTWAPLSQWHAERHLVATVSPWLLATGGFRSPVIKRFGTQLKQLTDLSALSSLGLGEALDYDFAFKDDLKQSGAVWVPLSGKWHLPAGLDLQVTKEYLDYLQGLPPAARYQRRWWNKSKFPVAPKTNQN